MEKRCLGGEESQDKAPNELVEKKRGAGPAEVDRLQENCKATLHKASS